MMEKLIEKISMQNNGLLRGNLMSVFADIEALEKEGAKAEVIITQKTSVSKENGKYKFGGEISWNKAVRHSDECEMEIYDPNQPDMFEKKKK